MSTYKDSVRKWWMRDQQKENLLVKNKEASGGGITETRRWKKNLATETKVTFLRKCGDDDPNLF